jgi:hypothetical protein
VRPGYERWIESWLRPLVVADDAAVFTNLHLHNRIDRYQPDSGRLGRSQRVSGQAIRGWRGVLAAELGA